jgi:putative ubiquitin-RnfH superfamily antitoxin RatB of RatAB toxin-antitoxin module
MQIVCVFSPGPRQIFEVHLNLAEGASVGAAIEIFKTRPELQAHLKALELALQQKRNHGVWGRLVNSTDALKPGDRLEIYRPLLVDPKFARKQRFKGQGKGRTGLFARRRVGSVAGY